MSSTEELGRQLMASLCAHGSPVSVSVPAPNQAAALADRVAQVRAAARTERGSCNPPYSSWGN